MPEPWTDTDTERIRWLREHRDELTDQQVKELRELRRREAAEVFARRVAYFRKARR